MRAVFVVVLAGFAGCSGASAPNGLATADAHVSSDAVSPADVSSVRDAAAPRDAGALPPSSCTAAPGGGRHTVATPVLRAALHGMGDEGWLGSAAVEDLDHDGAREIVVARGPRVIAYSAAGAMRWTATVTGSDRIWAAPVIGDFRGDGTLQVAAAAGDRVALFTAMGAPAPGFPVVWRDELRSLAGGDLDGDGHPDLVAVSTVPLEGSPARDVILAWHGTGQRLRGFPPNTTGASGCDDTCDVTGGFDQNVGVGDLDGDGAVDLLVPTDNAYMSWHHGDGRAFAANAIFHGAARTPAIRFFTDYAEAQQGYSDHESTSLQAHFTNSAPALADLDGDGVRDLVVLSSLQNASQTDRRRGVGLWALHADGSRLAAWVQPFTVPTYLAGLEDLGDNIVGATNQPSVADIDASSPGPEIIFAGFDGRIHCIGANRTERWSTPFTTAADTLTAGLAVADLSGDGVPEVVFATYGAHTGHSLVGLDARGAEVFRVALPGRGAMAVPTVADVDGDGAVEIVVSLKDPRDDGAEALVFAVDGSASNCLPWPTGRANRLRNGAPG